MTARTPAWWRALPAGVRITILATLTPGVVAHEAVHAGVAWRHADVTPDSAAVAVDVEWHQSAGRGVKVATYLAPALAGTAAMMLALGATGVLTRWWAGLVAAVGLVAAGGVVAYVAAQLLLFVVASPMDLAQAWVHARGLDAHETTNEVTTNVNE